MYSLPGNTFEQPQQAQQNPNSPQYPLRPAGHSSPFRINVKRSLKLHTLPAIMAALLTLGLGLALVARHKPTYISQSVIYVSPTFPKTLVEDEEQRRPYESYISEHVRAILDYSVLAEAIKRLPPGIWLNPGETERAGVQRLQESLEIKRVGTTYQVSITLNGTRPEHLAEIVNTITSVYLEKARNEEFYGRDDRLATLKEERNRVQTERDGLLQEQAEITKSLGVAAFSAKDGNTIDSENAKMQADLMEAHEKRIDAEAQLDALKSGDSNSPNSALNEAANDVIVSDPGLLALKSSLATKRAQLMDQLSGMTANNPVRKNDEDQLAQIDKEMQDMENSLRRKAAARLEQKYRSQLNSAQIVEARLNADLQKGTREADQAAPKLQRAQVIQADLERLQARYSEIDTRISNLELESSSPGSVHLFSPAMTPIAPEKSKITLFLILIFPFSLFVGVATAIILDLLDPHIYTGQDVESVLGFAPVGMLYDDREVTQVVFDECALRLAAGIDHAARAANARTFVITAVNSGAGTTSIIENLGSMLAKLGRKTLVIDPAGNSEPTAYVTLGADLQKRSVPFAGNSLGAGSGSTELQSLRGRPSPMSQLAPLNGFVFESFKSMSMEYDIVLVDAAPILLSAETEYLARMADVTVLVSEAGKTKKAWLTRAARLLERLGISGAAAVINKVNPARIDEAQKDDLREFELRSEKANLQDWWKPGRKSAGVNPSMVPNENGSGSASEEDVMFARDI